MCIFRQNHTICKCEKVFVSLQRIFVNWSSCIYSYKGYLKEKISVFTENQIFLTNYRYNIK